MVAYEKWSCTGGLIWKAFLVFWIGRRTWRFDYIFISCFVVSKSVSWRCSEAIPNMLNDVFSLFLVYF